MKSFERDGMLYLGKGVRPDGELLADEPLLYHARDLTTHAVCLGMTGSGKTGLGIALIEEAALEGIPALVVDPKGDMTNLLLTFPDLLPQDFRPWIDVAEARRQQIAVEDYADQVARSWREGLARWEIDGTRIARLRQSVDLTLFTPGSDAGRQVSIVRSLQPPALAWEDDAELLRETIASTVSALLTLVGVESDPVTGREHNLLATIIEQSWRAEEDMDLAELIVQIQKPSFARLGVLPLEVFYPERERMALTLALNGLLASPRFAAWLEGDALDVDALLRTPQGRPRVSILSLAHLSDAERLFFVTLLLEQVRTWLRMQEGTPGLRALLYFDELYGFMPPHPANPPTKGPLLALLKQARSQGLGLVLATQNPVDLDYKGLSNAGTWFIGKLQTANDRRRVLEGVGDAFLEAGTVLDRSALDETIAQLQARTFLLNNVHAEGPRLFRTRHTMSYLRGPLSRDQIRRLTKVERPSGPGPAEAQGRVQEVKVRFSSPAAPAPSLPPEWSAFSAMPPVLPPGIRQRFFPVQVSLEWAIRAAEAGGEMILYQDKRLVYRPALLAQATVRIDNSTRNVHEQILYGRVLPVKQDDAFVPWEAASLVATLPDLDDRPAQDALYAPLPALLGDERRLGSAQRQFAERAYRDTAISLLHHPQLKLTSRPGELESQFKRRCYQRIKEQRDGEMARANKDYEAKMDRLEAQIRREMRELERDETEYDARKREEVLSAGESVLNLLSRRRSSRLLSMASRKRRLTHQAKADVEESLEAIQDFETQIEGLAQDLEREGQAIQERWAEVAEALDGALQTVLVRPRKADVFVDAWGVAWLPYWEVLFEREGAQRQLSLPAFETALGASGGQP